MPPGSRLSRREHWYDNAIFYQVLVSMFKDGAGEGIGTLEGVREKLDYLQWLGVDCLWLPPFYASPLRDDGYDISDYYSIHPQFGTMEDFDALVAAAHERGMRIITDLALNHTSDQHEWFKQSRRDPDGPYGDYYVWSDHMERYPEIRIIFTDVETSNWAWDEVRQKYYFHRFYSHQPDLNYDNPAVHEEVFKVIRFWMDKGLDGFRLDAIPYLYERDGHGGESLPETHEFVRAVRRMMDEHYPDAIILAEANQPPAETVKYFGTGDEFHMCFNFPLMPRLFQALASADAQPIYDIMAQMPALPPTAQWATFLRNHDELTLEMVDDDKRQLMYDAYAPEAGMRAHVGIARRLAPLMGGDRRRIELMFSLLMTMPGAPFIYYGDEIGMGDDISLPDRDAVRTPMQWDDGPGAGFSTAPAASFRRPLISGGPYGFQSRNVAASRADASSLLNHLRNLIHLRKSLPVLGTGDWQPLRLGPSAPVLAFRRAFPAGESADGSRADSVVCLHNLSDQPQRVDLTGLSGQPDPAAWEVIAGSFESGLGTDSHASAPTSLTVPPFGYLWLRER